MTRPLFLSFVLATLSINVFAANCPEIFNNVTSRFHLSYERQCVGSSFDNLWRDQRSVGRVDIKDSHMKRIGAISQDCTTFETEQMNLQITDVKSRNAGFTLTVGKNKNAKSIFVYDCNENIVFVVNIGLNRIMIQGQEVSAAVSVYAALGSYPIAYIDSKDYESGLLHFRDTMGDLLARVGLSKEVSGGCEHSAWEVELYESNVTRIDPMAVALLLSYLALSSDPFNTCMQLAWEPFGLTLIIPASILFVAGVYKCAAYVRERNAKAVLERYESFSSAQQYLDEL